jgi:rubrerythrin/rhodanese-related sulfurtransferase
MPPSAITAMLPEDLRRYLEKHRESHYCLIDVRQPMEYAAGHLPGALLLPLPELETRLFQLPADRELVFYCSNGTRSRVAADLAAEAEFTALPIHHLEGGILAWLGRKLMDFPRVRIFPSHAEPMAAMRTAMDLEKGAQRFYRHLQARMPAPPLGKVLGDLAAAEEAHARTIYGLWSPLLEHPPPFGPFFEGLEGRLIEGGLDLEEALERAAVISGAPCRDLLELGLDVEYRAYDLYRALAEGVRDQAAREIFWSLAQAEKGHLRAIARALDGCPEVG